MMVENMWRREGEAGEYGRSFFTVSSVLQKDIPNRTGMEGRKDHHESAHR